ncbi:hypothetical protein [Nocardia tengchongensis]|uniref:hypothetical protein n=1 Tax=Nocardia tengchongensis TaxID=2055889 RepID=UPI00365154A1
MDKSTRRGQLFAMTKNRLATMYRNGIRRPDGHIVSWAEGAMPPERWRKEDLIARILEAEYPTADDIGPPKDGMTCRNGTSPTAVPGTESTASATIKEM